MSRLVLISFLSMVVACGDEENFGQLLEAQCSALSVEECELPCAVSSGAPYDADRHCAGEPVAFGCRSGPACGDGVSQLARDADGQLWHFSDPCPPPEWELVHATPGYDGVSPVPSCDASSPDFRRFRLSSGGGPCNVEDDCSAFIELHMDGTLRVDRWGEFPTAVHEATVSASDLGAAVPVLTNPELEALLGGPVLPCSIVTDSVVTMELVLADGALRNNVTTCEDPPIEAARTTMRQLAESYLPED